MTTVITDPNVLPTDNWMTIELFKRPPLNSAVNLYRGGKLHKSEQYLFPDIDQIVNTYLNGSGNIDVHLLMYCLLFSYGKYSILYGRNRQQEPALEETLPQQDREACSFPPELFPANFVAYEYGFKIPEVYDKFESGYYWKQSVIQRAQNVGQSLPDRIATEMVRFIGGSFNEALYNYYGVRAVWMMKRLALHKKLYNQETKQEVAVPCELIEQCFQAEHELRQKFNLVQHDQLNYAL